MKVHEVDVHPALPERLAWLGEIARNVWSSWSPEARDLFARLDPEAWERLGQNPVALLRELPQERLDAAAADESFVAMVGRVARRLDAYLESPGWLVPANPDAEGMRVGYFSLEFGLDAGIPLYSGGLGVLAGDHLKSASDIGVPLVGVGLLYRSGYFRQTLGPDGGQRERYPDTDWADLPIADQAGPDGTPVVVEVRIGEETVRAALRRIQVGRVPLLLLDSDIEGNSPAARDITSVLYGGDRDLRIRQEILLGVGGVRALEQAGLAPTVFHMNEGHSALIALERIRSLTAERGLSLAEARERVVASTVFTTHTPVPAGNEIFDPALARAYLEPLAGEAGMSWDDLAALAAYPEEGDAAFGMTPLALRTSGFANGVAALHGDTSRRMWRGLWPELPLEEVPITSVTNGIHPFSWLSREMHELLDTYIGPSLREHPEDPRVWERADRIPAGELWRVHELRRERLVLFARERLQEQLARQGSRRVAARAAAEALRPDALTVCFARRFATYKRADLLFRDPERLAALLDDEDRPIQFIVAGKAHPMDGPGKDLLRSVVQESHRPRLRNRVVFLEDYDMHVARYLVQGADVWLNVPRRPLEASGTSGMKAAVNGALNLSVLDGWWAEGYSPDCGWAIGSGETYDDPEENDAVEAEALYTLLEREVIPAFFTRDPSDRPRDWTAMMTASIRRAGATFSTGRMVREYAERAYIPAHRSAVALAAGDGALTRRLADWRERLRAAWPEVAVRSSLQAGGVVPVGSELAVEVVATLGALSIDDVCVEVVAGHADGHGGIVPRRVVPAIHEGGAGGEHRFRALVPAAESGRLACAARVVPRRPDGGGAEPGFLVAWEH
ncbi:alpha-glucan family phosphorylase [Miltoncostaea marina]|uniref:alpha-glucan family phosphorylase n=1 Tax=Miltoncostaea marina TaxID=2843215 RepID=UPI001C3C6ED0|nr:alpha-glucan family phosphorylase [Miltoncostaea marina]